MNKFLFVLFTVLIGVFIQVFFNHYFSFWGSGPQILLLLTIVLGFLAGPLLAEIVGFVLGMFSDAMGGTLFGQHMFLLCLAGFMAGMLQKRVASERPAAQIVIAFFGTCYFSLGTWFIDKFFESGILRIAWTPFFVSMIFNLALVTVIFRITEYWLHFWRIQPDIN
ncbi:MAG: rod shape-determining protein MreD [Elusimicrobiota bacterium]